MLIEINSQYVFLICESAYTVAGLTAVLKLLVIRNLTMDAEYNLRRGINKNRVSVFVGEGDENEWGQHNTSKDTH